jgi:resuscitation-promoting factor RpfC
MHLGGKQAMTFSSIAGPGVAKTLMAVTISMHPAAAHHHDGSHHVTVRRGDTLSAIAKREYGSAARWPALWWANRDRVHNPSSLGVGRKLTLSHWHPVKPWITKAALAAIPVPRPAAAPAPAPEPAAAPVSSAPVQSAPVQSAPVAAAPAQSTASYSGSGGYQSCVIQAESGGNASAVNPTTGAGGLYGFLPSTWHALGYSGSPQSASVSEQNAAFAKEYASAGSSAWSPYDGC